MNKSAKKRKVILHQLTLSPPVEGESARQAIRRSLRASSGMDPTYRLPGRVKRVPLRLAKTQAKAKPAAD